MTFLHSGRENIVSTVSELIGHTPLFHLGTAQSGSRLLLKLEQFNPTGSAKVRMARQMLIHAENSGQLGPEGHIIEPTSGNTGLGIALAAIERGYRFTAVVDHHASKDKLRAMAAMGANLYYVGDPETPGPRTLERKQVANELAASVDGGYRPDQHNHPGNQEGYQGLAHELLADIFGDLDYLISSVGTGGSLCGTARELRRLGSRVRTVGVEPVGSIIFGTSGGRYWQTGGGNPEGFPLGSNIDYGLIDEGVQVGDVAAFATARVLARRTGLLIGGTAGGAIYAALERLDTATPGSTIATLVCDAGEKYLDTIFDDDWMHARDLLDPTVEELVQQRLDQLVKHVPAPRAHIGAPDTLEKVGSTG
ncbi:PLP-dependent cysteine synthase family protein [Sciscionella marina]|uniref:PLP-dependent cysteine synthase family protein n=1 Tax=Sciscionella marina TaxID=508770 RepID=UPI00035D61D0|nr:cysteine synthase family protein [Sciscionella marina]